MRLLTFSVLKNCKSKALWFSLPRLLTSTEKDIVAGNKNVLGDPNLVEILPTWKPNEEPELRADVLKDLCVIPNFVTEDEEAALLVELEPILKRMRYEFDHWDNAIHGFRETERGRWSEHNERVLARLRALAFGAAGAGEPLPSAHVLDLAAAGHIKPHIDAVRFCGPVIAGVCLASAAVMQLRHERDARRALRALLPRRALYRLTGVARYSFTHEILGGDESEWKGEKIPRKRRIAVICRSKPQRDA